MRLHYYCNNCGSEFVLQDILWLGGRETECPLCGDDTGEFVALVQQKREDGDEVQN